MRHLHVKLSMILGLYKRFNNRTTAYTFPDSFSVLCNEIIPENSAKYELCSSKIQATGAELAEMEINFLKTILGEK